MSLYKYALESELSPHQKRVLRKLKKSDQLLAYHGMGSGKTLTGLAAAEEMGRPLTMIGPASLRLNATKEHAKHKIKAKLEYHSYNKPPPEGTYPFIVYDEAQRMGRLESKASLLPDTRRGRKTLLATGTPIRNDPQELVPLMRALGVDIQRTPGAFNDRFIREESVSPGLWNRWVRGVEPGVRRRAANKDEFRKLIRGKVDYHATGGTDFPEARTEVIKVPMSEKQDAVHRFVMGKSPLAVKVRSGLPPSKRESKQLNAFLGAARQVSNTPVAYNRDAHPVADAPKITRAVKEIEKAYKGNPRYRGVTYSNYIQSGLDPIAEQLKERGIPHGTFTGSQTQRQRRQILDDYEQGKLKHLLISSAGAEGLDLKGVRLMQILEPHWNDARIDQAAARAIRYKSHSHLPKDERKVQVQRFLAQPRRGRWPWSKDPKGADEYLYMLSKDKARLNEEFLDMLRTEGS